MQKTDADRSGLPLHGITVIDFSHYIAGPLASRIWADLGAQVIKIESPGGDNIRNYPPVLDDGSRRSAAFLWANRNKQSLAIDLKHPEGVALVKRLIARADVLIENFSTGAMDRLGLGFDECRALNERLIYCSISAYGREGRFRDRLGFDAIAQAESGFISMTGPEGGDGVKSRATIMDIGAAMMASNAVLAELVGRRGGEAAAKRIDVSLFDASIMMLGYTAMAAAITGEDPEPLGNVSADTAPTGVFHAGDRDFYMQCASNDLFQRLLRDVLHAPELSEHPHYLTASDRLLHRRELAEELNRRFAEREWLQWKPLLREAKIPVGELRTVTETLQSPEAEDRELFTQIPDAASGSVPDIALPIRVLGAERPANRSAPALGEHAEEILGAHLGLDPETIAELESAGVIRRNDAAR